MVSQQTKKYIGALWIVLGVVQIVLFLDDPNWPAAGFALLYTVFGGVYLYGEVYSTE